MQDALDDDDEFDINETTFESGNLFFSRRQAIHMRMQRILVHFRETLTDQPGCRPELIVVAHSQGTQIAIEVLNDPELDWLKNRFRSVRLITMGSPFTNLYQHYFGHIYPALDSPYWASLRQRLDQWANIFRIDDPVGTEIDFSPLHHCDGVCGKSDGHELTGPVKVSNHAVGCRGHVQYWTDREVLSIIQQVVFADERNASLASQNRRAA
jgi:pimeloyl-ACP methyl ester carboxylesterase